MNLPPADFAEQFPSQMALPSTPVARFRWFRIYAVFRHGYAKKCDWSAPFESFACMVRIIGSALLLVVALQVHSAHAEEGQDSISKDTRLLLSVKNEKGSVWQSEALQLKCKANSRSKGILVIKFAPFTVASRENPPQLSAKLSLASVPEEVEGFTELSTSIGDQNYRDVRLAEKNGVKTITFTRAIESVDKPTDKTPKILEQHFSITFEYELRDDELVLKGFPTDETTWGIVQFTTQAKQVSFRPAK